MGIETAVVAGLLLTGFLLTSLWVRLPAWTLVDVFLLAIALYFGVYTLLDALSADESNHDPVLVATVFTLIAFGSTVLWLFARARIFPETALARLQQDWRACHPAPIIALIVLALSFRWYTAEFFSELGALGETELMAIEQDLPYWYTSIGMIVSTTIFAAGICAWGKVGIARGWKRLFWLAATGASAFIVMGAGRRSILAMLIVIGWTILVAQRGRRSSWGTLAVVILAMPVLVALSNVYQAYRLVSHRGVPLENVIAADDVGSLVEEVAAVGRTVSNLKERQAVWRFNYEVVKAHVVDGANLQWGELLAGEFPNYVPSALYPGKVWIDSEETLLRAFGLEVYDRPSNVFAYTYADFGMLSAVLAPALLLFWCWVCATALRFLRDPFLRVLLMGMAIFYAINMETGYLVPIGHARDFVLLALLYVTARGTLRAARFLVSVRPAPDHQ